MAVQDTAAMTAAGTRLVDALMGYEPFAPKPRRRYLATFHTDGPRGAPDTVHGYGVKDLETGEMVFFEAVASYGWNDNAAALAQANEMAAALNRGGSQAERVRRRLSK